MAVGVGTSKLGNKLSDPMTELRTGLLVDSSDEHGSGPPSKPTLVSTPLLPKLGSEVIWSMKTPISIKVSSSGNGPKKSEKLGRLVVGRKSLAHPQLT